MSLPRSPRATLEIDCDALRHNLEQVKRITPEANVMAVVKANAYGHGMELVAGVLADCFDQYDEFAVSDFNDVARLRKAGIEQGISTFSAQFSDDQISDVDDGIAPAIFDHSQLISLKNAKFKKPIDVWLKVDTGMGRLGFLPSEVEEVLSQLRAIIGISNIGLMAHFANADAPDNAANAAQLKLTNELAQQYEFDAISIFNSAGICGLYDGEKWALPHCVRPGLMLYGASPLVEKSAHEMNLKPVMKFAAQLVSIRTMPAGSRVGYGGTVTLEKDTRVGVVACGYGDGYPRHAKNGTPVFINGKLSPLLGRVSMDMISVDLSGVEANVGDEAILWGLENPIENVAKFAATIPYTLMCGITERVHRQVNNG